MVEVMKEWFDRFFSDREAVFLTVMILAAVLLFAVLGSILVPIIASIIIAYMLSGFVRRLQQWKVPQFVAVLFIYVIFLASILVLLIWLLPLLFQQLANFVAEVPHFLATTHHYLIKLQASYPDLFSADQLQKVLAEFNEYISRAGQIVLSFSVASIGNVITVTVYLILVPLLVFFFMKDREAIQKWLLRFVPSKRLVLSDIWCELDGKIGDYIRGKIIEIAIVALVSSIVFLFMGLNYAILLGVAIGLSVIIPYVGAVLVTIPVVIIALLQWGWSAHFAYVIIVYAVIIAVDANLLVPILFSEKMKLHPVVIILSVLFFGGIWGFWGIFFAIPLATLVNTLLKRWPRVTVEE